MAANQKGIGLIQSLIAEYGLAVVLAYMQHVQDNCEGAVRDLLRQVHRDRGLGPGARLQALDHLDDGTPVALSVTIDAEQGSAVFDFTGTGPQVHGNVNAPRAITLSAIIYCLRCLVDRDVPLNQGVMAPIHVIIPQPSVLHPSPEAGVVGGNVLTSQRITDVVLEAFGAAANSQGCMNNLTFGCATFGYYETIAGGSGAGPDWDGEHGVQCHMTNTATTDAEATAAMCSSLFALTPAQVLERNYPVILREFSLRRGSGGAGLHRGGDGVVREIEFCKDGLSVGILSERRALAPRGLQGGQPGSSCWRGMEEDFSLRSWHQKVSVAATSSCTRTGASCPSVPRTSFPVRACCLSQVLTGARSERGRPHPHREPGRWRVRRSVNAPT